MSVTWDTKNLKATPIAADEILVIDTADGRNQKRVTLASLDSAIGHVDGPLSSLNNSIPTFSGTTGKIIQDTGAMFIDPANKRVGIGVNNPSATLHVFSSDAGFENPDGDADDFIIENNGNTGYTTPPTVVIAAPPTTITAVGTAVLGIGIGAIASGLPSGTGYTDEETVVLTGVTSGANNATGNALVTGGVIEGIIIVNIGSGYSTNESLTIVGQTSGATDATAVSTTTEFVASITITNAGLGYVTAPTITIAAPTGSNPIQATATSSLVNTSVTVITITNVGRGYETASIPAVTFTAAPTAVTATATANISGGKVVSTTITNAGIGYHIPPSVVTFTGGDGNGVGVDTVTVANSSIQSITVTAGGTGMTIFNQVNQVGVINFEHAGGPSRHGSILYDHAVQRMRFFNTSVQGLTIDQLGHVAVSPDNADHDEMFTVDSDTLDKPTRILISDTVDRLMLGYNGVDPFKLTATEAQVIVPSSTGDLAIASRGNLASNLIFYTSGGSTLAESMRITSSGNLIVDTDTLFVDAVNDTVQIGGTSGLTDFTIFQNSINVNKGITLSGTSATGPASTTEGVTLHAGFLGVGNNQLWVTNKADLGNAGKNSFRYIVGPDVPLIVGINNTGSANKSLAFGLDVAEANCGFGFTTSVIQGDIKAKVHVQAGDRTRIALIAQAAAAPLDNIFEIRDSTGATMASFTRLFNLDMKTNKIENVADPTALQDAATKNYVDTITTNAIWTTSGGIISPTTASNVTIPGNLTVDTDTLFVDSANNRVGIGTIIPDSTLDIHQSIGGNGSVRIECVNNDTSGFTSMFLLSNIGRSVELLVGGPAVTGDFITGIPNANIAKVVGSADNFVVGNISNFPVQFITNSIERMRIDGAGKIIVGNTGGTNHTISFGANFGAPALLLFDGGVNLSHGWGLQPGSMQFFQVLTSHTWTWNIGGSLQPVGTNEVMRLTGNGNLSLTGTLNLNSNIIQNVTNPVAQQDAVTLNYLESNFASTSDVLTAQTLIIGNGTKDVKAAEGTSGRIHVSANNEELLIDALQPSLGMLAIRLRSSVGTPHLEFFHSEVAETSTIFSASQLGISAIGKLTVVATTDMEFNVNAGDIFFTTNTGTERMRMLQSGFFGVGTPTPGTILHSRSLLADTVPLITREVTGTNGGITKTFIGNRDPNGVVTGAGGDEYIKDAAALSATFESREATTGTAWLKRALVGSNTFEIHSTAEFDALASNFESLSSTIAAGGTGYTVGDDITLVGGTGTASVFNVDTVSAGVVTAVSVVTAGDYTVKPTDPISTTGGTGTGCTLNVVFAGIITLSSDTLFLIKAFIGTTTRIALTGGISFHWFNQFSRSNGTAYTGPGKFISGAGSCRASGSAFFGTPGNGSTFIDITNGSFNFNDCAIINFDNLGTLNGGLVFHIDVVYVNALTGFNCTNITSIECIAVEYFGSDLPTALFTIDTNVPNTTLRFLGAAASNLTSTGSLLDISTKMDPTTIINVRDSNNDVTGSLYKQGDSPNATINSVADSSPALGDILTLADDGNGNTIVGVTEVTYFDAEDVTIAGTVNANGTFQIFEVVANTSFKIRKAFVSTEAVVDAITSKRIDMTLAAGHNVTTGMSIKSINTQFYNIFYTVLNLTGDVITLNDTFVLTDTGTIERNVSLDETDLRINGFNNGNEPDSQSIAFGSTNANTTATTITTNEIYVPINVTGFISSEISELFRLVDPVAAKYRYIGLKPFKGFLTGGLWAVKVGATGNYRFAMGIDGVVPIFATAKYSPMEVKSTQISMPTFFEVNLVENQTIQIFVAPDGNTDDITITDIRPGIQ